MTVFRAAPGVAGALLLLAAFGTASAADRDFPWAAEARASAPAGWVGGQVIGFDPTSNTGVIALYPRGDDSPTTPGRALELRLDERARPIRPSATARDRKPTETIFFQTSPGPFYPGEFKPAAHLPPGTTACSVGAWTHDPDPKGLNLRAEPTAASRVVAKLPRLASSYEIEFRIVGFKAGWFLIEGAEDPDYDQNAPKTEHIYPGRGWVAGNLVMSSVASPELLSSPHDDASVLLTLSGTVDGVGYGPDSVAVRRLLACNQTWTQVEVEDPPTKTLHTGWVERLCSNQVTTCP